MSRHLFYHLALAVKIGMDALAEVEKYMETIISCGLQRPGKLRPGN